MIVADADFLSAFLKIDRLNLVFEALETKEIVIAGGVLHELEQAQVYSKLLEALHSQQYKIIVQDIEHKGPEDLGRGERESILLAQKSHALLLMDDRKAAQYAQQEGITVLSIPAFLFFCKTGRFLSHESLRDIITELKEKDYYEFTEEVKRRLLE